MNKFSKILHIKESTKNTFLLNKNIDDVSEEYNSIVDMLKTFQEGYPNDIKSYSIERGYATEHELATKHSVSSMNIMGLKKIKKIFPTGIIPDKWKLSIKVLIEFLEFKNKEEKILPQWAKDEVFDINTIDITINRYKAIKTLAERCQFYAKNVKISYNVGIGNGKIALLIFFD